ncbi:MAG: class I SAM-dependent RNA methyltransferase [Planctomycetota bacterium]
MTGDLSIIALTAFGLERVIKHELLGLGFEPTIAEPGRVRFSAPPAAIPTVNIWLRSASRVLVELDAFPCREFDALYDGVRALPWRDLLPARAGVGVQVSLTRSTINSPRNAQSMVKRAVVDAVVGRGAAMDESGPPCTVSVAIRGDEASVCLDTSGAGLHQRGYRPRSGPGQLKETLAAGIIQLTRWTPDRPLIDPFCGQGTLVIEAALLAAGLPPGVNRGFAGEALPWIDRHAWHHARQQAEQTEPVPIPAQVLGRDIDDRAIGEARRAAERAGVRGLVGFRRGDYLDTPVPAERGWIVTNPPYGLRVLDHDDAAEVHSQLPILMDRLPQWSHGVLTAFPRFESLIKRTATKRRKLYNGSIECGLYFFHPVKAAAAD